MSAQIIDGRALATGMKAALKMEVDGLKVKTGKTPCFVTLVVGDDASAASYGKAQQAAAEMLGIKYRFLFLPHSVSQGELADAVKCLNADHGVHGIMLNKPLPDTIDFQAAVDHILPLKDLEGLNRTNLGAMFLGDFRIVPCTAAAVMALLEETRVDLAGKHAVIVGRSEIVGKPLAHLILSKNATLTVCHSGTFRAGRLEEEVARAEILVVAMGRPGFISGSWVRPGAVVIDVGINSVDGKITGDVEFSGACQRAGFITPVPGGVGPVTAVCLMRNGIELYKRQTGAGA